MTKQQLISSDQIKGTFDKKIKLKIALEEWIQSELNYQLQQHEKLLNVRILLIDSLFQRPSYSVSAFWYEFTKDDIWVFASYSIVKRLDQNLFSLFLKLVVDTIHIHLNGELPSKNLLDAEKEAYRRYVDDMIRIRATKAITLADRLKQVLFLFVNQYYREKIPLINTKNIIPQPDNHLQEKLSASFSKIKILFNDYQKRQSLDSVKIRMIPYMFQDIIHDKKYVMTSPLRLKVVHSIISKTQQDKNLFSIIIFSSQFIEMLPINSKLLDYLITFELISIENAQKFNRGIMEQEILSIVSKDQDASERILYSYFSKEEINEAKKELEVIINGLLFDKRVNILRIID
jgi:hypothetical protein